jgi:hypothetical protein
MGVGNMKRTKEITQRQGSFNDGLGLVPEVRSVGERGRKRLSISEKQIIGALESAKKGYWKGAFLWANNENVDTRDEKGVTLLMVAVAQGRESTAVKLVHMGADVKAVDNEGHGIEWYEENGKDLFPVQEIKSEGTAGSDPGSFEGMLGC